jgi:hypothetical protein
MSQRDLRMKMARSERMDASPIVDHFWNASAAAFHVVAATGQLASSVKRCRIDAF